MNRHAACCILLPLALHLPAQEPAPVPRARVAADLVARADDTYRKLQRPEPAYGCRELFTAMLAYAEAGTNLTRVAELLTRAEAMQNRDPAHRAYGNFRWYARDAEVLDYNAVDFCMQHGALLWRRHRDALDPATRARLLALLRLGLTGLVNHRPRATYTNIALLNASDLVLLGEALGEPRAAEAGARRLRLFALTLWEEGLHEYVSPTYYGVNVEALLLLEALAHDAPTRALAGALLRVLWTDIALNWYAPAQRLAGAHSRTYDYVYGYGELDQILAAFGWLPCDARFRFATFTPLYAGWRPPADLWALCTTRYPRLVEQTWGAEPYRSRTHFVCPDVTLSTAWQAYHGRMDIALAADLPGGRAERLPRLSFIPDGRGDPYGKRRVFDGKTHAKAFHLSPWWAGVQDGADALGVAVYRDGDFKDATGTLESHLLFRRRLDSLWIGEQPVRLEAQRPTSRPVPPGAAVFLRQGTAAIGIRVPWTRGQDGAPAAVSVVDDNNPYGAARLTVTHAWLDPTNHPHRACAGAAFWLRAGSGLADDDAFAAFRRAFAAAAARVEATPDALDIRVAGLAQPLAVAARAPFDRDPVTSPTPPRRAMLGLDGRDLGREALEQSPVIQAYLRTRRAAQPVAVAAGGPTVWEAENARLTVPYEVWTNDASASAGAYLWVPEEEDQQGGGSGAARYTLHVAAAGRYRLAGRVLTPTPSDDSFFLSVLGPAGETLLPETAWSPGVFRTWTWRDVSESGQRRPAELDLPAGAATLVLRPREAGAKLDQLRLTPVPRDR